MPSHPYPIVYTQTKRRAVGGAAIQITEEVPVLPTSHALLTLDCQVITSNQTDNPLTLLGGLSNISFLYRGANIWSLSAVDLARVAWALCKWNPQIYAVSLAGTSRRLVTLLLPFGRNLFDTAECFPQSQRGECSLVLSFTATSGNYNNYIYTLDYAQLPDARPKQFLRATTMQLTPTSTGDQDLDLPRAAPLAACGFVVSNSEPSAATADIESIKILLANQDTWYANAFWPSYRPMVGVRAGSQSSMNMHAHIENTAGAYSQNATTISNLMLNDLGREFAWLPFDPTGDGKFALDGSRSVDLKARITFNATNTCRILPVELWTPQLIGKKE